MQENAEVGDIRDPDHALMKETIEGIIDIEIDPAVMIDATGDLHRDDTIIITEMVKKIDVEVVDIEEDGEEAVMIETNQDQSVLKEVEINTIEEAVHH